MIPNEVLNNPNMSARAKGLYAYIQSKPNDWDFSTDRIAKDHLEGRDAIRNAVTELEEQRFLRREKIRLPNGTFDVLYTLYEYQYESTDEKITATENPTSDFPTSGNQAINIKKNTKQEKVKKSI